MLGENGRRRAVVRPDILEDGAVARLLGMMIDHQVHAVECVAEVVRLHVDHRDTVEARELIGRDVLDVDVEQVLHADVFRTRGALLRGDIQVERQIGEKIFALTFVSIAELSLGILKSSKREAAWLRVRKLLRNRPVFHPTAFTATNCGSATAHPPARAWSRTSTPSRSSRSTSSPACTIPTRNPPNRAS